MSTIIDTVKNLCSHDLKSPINTEKFEAFKKDALKLDPENRESLVTVSKVLKKKWVY